MAERTIVGRLLEKTGLRSTNQTIFASSEVSKAREIYEDALARGVFAKSREFKTDLGADFLRLITDELEAMEQSAVKREKRDLKRRALLLGLPATAVALYLGIPVLNETAVQPLLASMKENVEQNRATAALLEEQRRTEEALRAQKELEAKREFESKYTLGTSYSSTSYDGWKVRYLKNEEQFDLREVNREYLIPSPGSKFGKMTYLNLINASTNTDIRVREYTSSTNIQTYTLDIEMISRENPFIEKWMLLDQTTEDIKQPYILLEHTKGDQFYATIRTVVDPSNKTRKKTEYVLYTKSNK